MRRDNVTAINTDSNWNGVFPLKEAFSVKMESLIYSGLKASRELVVQITIYLKKKHSALSIICFIHWPDYGLN